MKKLAIIPARSGSKGLKDKNIKLLNGQPLLAYTIQAATKSNMFDRVVVSTDSEEYKRIAVENGAEVPFLRSDDLANDTASSWDVVKDVLTYFTNKQQSFETVALLQPTSPLRTAENIIEAFDLYERKNADFVVSVCESEIAPLITNTIPDDLSMVDFLDKNITKFNRQSFTKYYSLNGAIYIVKVKHLFESYNLYSANSYAYIMNRLNSIDIDDEFDFDFAEFVLNKIGNK